MNSHRKLSQLALACTTILSFSAFSMLAGCFAGEDEANEFEPELGVEADDPVFRVTRIDMSNGGRVLAEGTIRLSEQLAANAAEDGGRINDEYGESRDAAVGYGLCLSSDLKLYDAYLYTGNVLCLTGTGDADLNTYGWWGDVRSLKAGNATLVAASDSLITNCCTPRDAYEEATGFSFGGTHYPICEDPKRYIRRGSGCTPT